eukprot:SAG25_NODE_70_length_17370_cov_11.748885_3_plen_41_part_00
MLWVMYAVQVSLKWCDQCNVFVFTFQRTAIRVSNGLHALD